MNDTFENAALLTGRVLLAAIFLHEGAVLIPGYSAAAAYMAKLGVPEIALAPTIALQIVAGLMLVTGVLARPGALALGLFCVATAFLAHTNFANRNELLHFEKDLAIAGGMFTLAARGAGAWTLARLIAARAVRAA